MASVNKKREKERKGEEEGTSSIEAAKSLRKCWTTIMRFKAAVLYNNARFTLVDRDIDLAWNAA